MVFPLLIRIMILSLTSRIAHNTNYVAAYVVRQNPPTLSCCYQQRKLFTSSSSIRTAAATMLQQQQQQYLLYPRHLHKTENSNTIRRPMSVSGIIYHQNDEEEVTNDTSSATTNPEIVVKLFTKEGCTLCDKVKDVLYQTRTKYPHTLIAVDITDPIHIEWYERYQYDIPVLHINNQYWCKHRISIEQAEMGLQEVQAIKTLHNNNNEKQNAIVTPIGTEPNASKGSRPKGSTTSNSSSSNGMQQ